MNEHRIAGFASASALFPIEDPRLVPARRYHDAGFFEAETGRLWPRVWQMACRLEDIPEVGDWVEYRLLDQSVIVVRTREGVKAFENACRHRGMRLAKGSGNCRTRGFICPFHGWRWGMDGRNGFVFSRDIFDPAQLDAAEIDLVPVRVEAWRGAAFVNLDDGAPPLADCLDGEDWDRPVPAMQAVCGPYEAPIRDLGLP